MTGGNSGLGEETARVLALHGCRVIITSRSANAAEDSIKRIQQQNATVKKSGLPSRGELSYVLLDLTDLDSVKESVDCILKQTKVVDYLILNAGVLAPPYTKTKHGMELQIGELKFRF